MALPYPTKVVLPFDIATAQDMNERHANDVALANGSGLDDGAVTSDKLDSATYSTTEQVVGTWVDGRTLYRKTINTGSLPNNSTKQVSINVPGFREIISLSGVANSGYPGTNRPLPYVSTALNNQVQVYVLSSGMIDITTASNLSVYINSYVTITYTKM